MTAFALTLLKLLSLVVVGALALALLASVARALTALFRLLGHALAAALYGLGVGLVAGAGAELTGRAEAGPVGLMAGAVTFTAMLAKRLRGRGEPAASASRPPPSPASAPRRFSPAPAPPPPPPPAPPPRDPELHAAWISAATAAPSHVARLSAARARCERLLDRADADPLDLPLADWAQFVRRRAPELVGATLARARRAAPAERDALLAALVDDLEAIAAEAERRVGEMDRAEDDRLRTLRAHVANRTTD